MAQYWSNSALVFEYFRPDYSSISALVLEYFGFSTVPFLPLLGACNPYDTATSIRGK